MTARAYVTHISEICTHVKLIGVWLPVRQLVEAERALRYGTSCSVSAYKKLRLLEAFPSCSPADAEAALKRCNGDMDQAAAMIGSVNADGVESRG